MSRRILITRASIAGHTAAWWLGRSGCDVTVVERAPAFRGGGQNVDVRGVGRAVLRRMGPERAALDGGTGEEGTAWIDGQGRIAARFDLDASDAAVVTFASGLVDRYGAVIVAEGVGSATRERVFPDENAPRWMGLTIASFTIPRAPDGRGVSLRPDPHGTTRAMRPMVEGAQGVPRIAPKLMNPRSPLGIRLLHGALNVASKPAVRRLTGKLFGGQDREPDLSAYGVLPA